MHKVRKVFEEGTKSVMIFEEERGFWKCAKSIAFSRKVHFWKVRNVLYHFLF
jgi:hypothetical protein